MPILEKGRYRGLNIPDREVHASNGEDRVRCGVCGGMKFEVHVKPHLTMGKITAIICTGCTKVRKVDEHNFIEAHGIHSVGGLADDWIAPPPNMNRGRQNGS